MDKANIKIVNKDIRVLFWLSQFPVVSETFIRDQIIGLSKEAVPVHIYCQKFNKELAPTIPDFESQEWLQSVFEGQAARVEKGNKMISFIKTLGRVFFHKRIQKVRFLKQFWKNKGNQKELRKLYLIDYVLEKEINVVHAHFGPNGIEACALNDWGLPIRLVTTFHGYDIRLGMEQEGLYDSLFAKAYKIISISKFNTEKLVSFGASSELLAHIPNGVDTSLFTETKAKRDDDSVKFLSVARLVDDKALHIALEGLEAYHKEHPEISFYYDIIGEGYLRESLENLINGLQIRDRIRLLGAKNTMEVRDVMMAADAFLLSSKNEALPTVLLEAQASGLVILSTDVGSIKDMLVDAVLVPPNSVSAFKEGIISLLNRKGEWMEMRAVGRKNVEENYSAQVVIKQLLELYKAD